MQRYPVRPSHRKNLEPGSLATVLTAHFDSVAADGATVTASFGAIQRLAARAAGRELEVELTMDPKVPERVAAETIQRYNRFLEAATGYGSKERARRLRKAATAAPSGD
ncbi:MAG: DUF5611 family protein [Thermoplasmata archaeon]